ncbi:diacylglycerol kinase family protein [Romeriopsis navalis]|nr:diacylglycerol kinase family protein [Romeriopsis navalis]
MSSESTSPEMPTQSSKRDGKVLPFKSSNRDLAWHIAPSVFGSLRYAWMGISYAFQTQRNFRIHTIVGSIAIGLGIWLQLPAVELTVIGITIGLVLAMELLNTAIEAVVDLTVKQNYHELAKIAKDCAAAAVLISAFAALGVAGCLILPKLAIVVLSVLG